MKNSSSALHIRPARREAPALVDLLMRTYETTWMPQMSAQTDARFRASGKTAAYVAERGLLFHVCELDGTVAGMVDWEGNFIWALHVQPTCSDAAWAPRCWRWPRPPCARPACARRAWKRTTSMCAAALYARNGYQEIDTYPDEEWDSGFTTVLLSKRLAD